MCKRLTNIILMLLIYTSVIGQYTDGTYCAAVQQYNPRTYKQSSYTLTVGIDDSHVIRIDWPNGGHLDTDHFTAAEIQNGFAVFVDDRGHQYKVNIIKKGSDCWEGGSALVRCSGTTKSGSRCKNKTGNISAKCWRHE